MIQQKVENNKIKQSASYIPKLVSSRILLKEILKI